jgi:hypothetical protein
MTLAAPNILMLLRFMPASYSKHTSSNAPGRPMPAFSGTCYVLELIGYTGVLATN